LTGGCLLCALAAGELERSLVGETERAVAIMDIRPVNPGHVLVFARAHAPGLLDWADEDAAEVLALGRRVAAALYASSLRCEGVNLFLADGETAGQEVFHVHLHVIPRFEGDGFGLRFGPDYRVRDRAELDEAAARLREGLV